MVRQPVPLTDGQPEVQSCNALNSVTERFLFIVRPGRVICQETLAVRWGATSFHRRRLAACCRARCE